MFPNRLTQGRKPGIRSGRWLRACLTLSVFSFQIYPFLHFHHNEEHGVWLSSHPTDRTRSDFSAAVISQAVGQTAGHEGFEADSCHSRHDHTLSSPCLFLSLSKRHSFEQPPSTLPICVESGILSIRFGARPPDPHVKPPQSTVSHVTGRSPPPLS
jgi:hypothetical protein